MCPDDWHVAYGTPQYLGDYCHVACTLTVCGIRREGMGSAQITVSVPLRGSRVKVEEIGGDRQTVVKFPSPCGDVG
ncbi:MAG TPA: hypothetical protein V6C88_19800 [Chroococcidiopsis sp.]